MIELQPAPAPHPGMVYVPGGTFRMGSDHHYPDEGPAHPVEVDGFWMDRTPVTNAAFARFVEETGHVTVAERAPDPAAYPGADPALLQPGSLVFVAPAGPVNLRDPLQWWRFLPGASWRCPEGPGSTIEDRLDHPVVHVAWDDVEAYARWAGKDLPTEAEWERAARGGLEEATYAWGEDFQPEGRIMAHTWQGRFPVDRAPGSGTTAPVGAHPPNGYDLLDLIGNVWEWTADFYLPRHPAAAQKACCIPRNPRCTDEPGSTDPFLPAVPIPRRVLKGGSFLCAPNYCQRYRPAARHPEAVDTSASHIGFRCVTRA